MKTRRPQEPSSTRAACAVLVFVLLFAAAAAAADGPEPGSGAYGVVEPLFEFLITLAEGDSLGAWTGADIGERAARMGRISKFPLEALDRIERRRPTAAERSRWPDTELTAVWTLSLTGTLDRPMPYSILGYHPGSLRVSRRLVLSELALGRQTFLTEGGDGPEPRRVDRIRAMRLDAGSVVLDADAVPDFILRGNLDDAWTLGFVLASEGEQRVGLAVSIRRDGGPIFGQFDFVEDRIMKSGSPLGSMLSRYCRGWFTRPESQPQPSWVEVP